jgi:hypothetical protein
VIIGGSAYLVLVLREKLTYTFEMTDLSLFHLFLDIQVLQMDDGIRLFYVGLLRGGVNQ